eukprot:sb/3472977/
MVLVTDPAECDGEFVANEYSTIKKVGFNDQLKDDGAKKMIKKDDRVYVKKTRYASGTFNLQLVMDSVMGDDSGDVELTVKDVGDGGASYTNKVKLIYTGGSDLKTDTVSATKEHTTTYTAKGLKDDSCLEYKCSLTYSGMTVETTNKAALIYGMKQLY